MHPHRAGTSELMSKTHTHPHLPSNIRSVKIARERLYAIRAAAVSLAEADPPLGSEPAKPAGVEIPERVAAAVNPVIDRLLARQPGIERRIAALEELAEYLAAGLHLCQAAIEGQRALKAEDGAVRARRNSTPGIEDVEYTGTSATENTSAIRAGDG